MNTEKLDKANDIHRQIEDLKRHRDDITLKHKQEDRATYELANSIRIRPTYRHGNMEERVFRKQFLPISIPDLIDLYVKKLDTEIERLQAEFEKL